MIRRQDIGLLLFYYLGYSRIRNLIIRLKHKPVAQFLTFHDVLPEFSQHFRAKMYFLLKQTNVISIDDFLAGRLSTVKINTILTFDDGYRGWLVEVIPILKELKLPAIFFVSSGFVGLTKTEEDLYRRRNLFKKLPPRKISGCLRSDDLRRIVHEGFSIGGHTLNHCNLSELDNIDQLRFEIESDKTRLERITGHKVHYFAYPCGEYTHPSVNLISLLQHSGYKAAVTTISGFNDNTTQAFLLHRELTDVSLPFTVFKARVYGNYEAVKSMKKFVKSVDDHADAVEK